MGVTPTTQTTLVENLESMSMTKKFIQEAFLQDSMNNLEKKRAVLIDSQEKVEIRT